MRAFLDGAPVVDSARAVLVWEPGRIVPGYAVPEEDVAAELLPLAGRIRGMICFLDEAVDVTVDGVRRERPVSPWSQPGRRATA